MRRLRARIDSFGEYYSAREAVMWKFRNARARVRSVSQCTRVVWREVI